MMWLAPEPTPSLEEKKRKKSGREKKYVSEPSP